MSDLGSSSSIYPWPRKIFVPNDDSTHENSATHIVKNKERTLLETTYQGDYSNCEGIGTHVISDTTPILQPNEQLVNICQVFLV